MDWSQIWPVMVAAVGGSGLFTVAIQEFGKWRSGQAAEERQENLSLAKRTELAEAWREYESTYRRKISEYCSKLRRKLFELGATDEQVGDWPTPPDKPQLTKD